MRRHKIKHAWTLRPAKSRVFQISALLPIAVWYLSLAKSFPRNWAINDNDKHTARIREPSAFLDAWVQFPTGFDEKTAEVQHHIYESQNPLDCENRNYFLWTPFNFGMGADIHITGCALAFAMERNRTLLYHPKAEWVYTSPDTCQDTLNPDCFFKPLSRCQYILDSISESAYKKYNQSTDDWNSHQFVELDNTLRSKKRLIPNIGDWRAYDRTWWRSQSTRFIVHPSSKFLAWTKDYFARSLQRYPRIQGWSSVNFPPPSDAICMHIRHGDKYKESRLHSIDEFLKAATELVKNNGSSRNIFFTTDNGTLIQEIERGAYQHYNFTFYYTSYERRVDDLRPVDIAKTMGGGLFGSISIANLLLGVHPSCKWFVQTTSSNWNRLINEIRKTDGIRYNAPWIDLEFGEW